MSRGNIVEYALAIADVRQVQIVGAQYQNSESRAYCPLCGEGRVVHFGNHGGYAYPRGLMQHLEGNGARYCPVARIFWINPNKYRADHKRRIQREERRIDCLKQQIEYQRKNLSDWESPDLIPEIAYLQDAEEQLHVLSSQPL